MVHSAEDGSIPVPDNLAVITELQAVALAIRMFGLDGLDKQIVREPLSNPQQLEGEQ